MAGKLDLVGWEAWRLERWRANAWDWSGGGSSFVELMETRSRSSSSNSEVSAVIGTNLCRGGCVDLETEFSEGRVPELGSGLGPT